MKTTPAALLALASSDLDNFITASTPGGIEKQEVEGQKQLVASDVLPIDCPRAELESLGFKFGDPVDDVFVAVKMPEGWLKNPTDHSMWSDIVDNKGRKRGGIFYKAAFYDRRAFMRLDVRYVAVNNYDLERQEQAFVIDNATGEHVFSTEIVDALDSGKSFEIGEGLERKAIAHLDHNYPNHKDPLAYWD